MQEEYSVEQLEKIKDLSAKLMRPTQIALLTGIDEEVFKRQLKNRGSQAWKAYETGRAETILQLREQEIKLAKLGSPLAVEMVHKFIKDQDE